ncbi:MAG: hypothetical protein WA984_14275 [Phormidesmis sp.]
MLPFSALTAPESQIHVPLSQSPPDQSSLSGSSLSGSSSRKFLANADLQRNRHGQNRQMPTAWRPLSTEAFPSLPVSFEQAMIEGHENFCGVYTDFAIAEYRLRLYALIESKTGCASSIQRSVEASLAGLDPKLLLALSPLGNSYLPIGTELTIAENDLLHSGQNMRCASSSTYLYTQVFGDWTGQFTPAVRLPRLLPVKLSPLKRCDRDGKWNLLAISES